MTAHEERRQRHDTMPTNKMAFARDIDSATPTASAPNASADGDRGSEVPSRERPEQHQRGCVIGVLKTSERTPPRSTEL
jgi:hypothetical protein